MLDKRFGLEDGILGYQNGVSEGAQSTCSSFNFS